MVLCRSILRPHFFISFRILLVSQGLPAWISRLLLCCALVRTPSNFSISWMGILLKSFYLHDVSNVRMSKPSTFTLSVSSSICVGVFWSSSIIFWWILRERVASNSMAEACMTFSTSAFSDEVEAGKLLRVGVGIVDGGFGTCGGEEGEESTKGGSRWSYEVFWEVRIENLFWVLGLLELAGGAGDFLACRLQLGTFVNPSLSLLGSLPGVVDYRFKGKSLKIWPCAWHFLQRKGMCS